MDINEFKCYRVFSFEKSIPVIDEFLFSEENFEFLILDNWLRIYAKEKNEKDISISLCVSEKCYSEKICSDDITMTKLKERHYSSIPSYYNLDEEPFGLFPSVFQAISKIDVSAISCTEMIPLEYAVHLRAQGSHNREGYGWEWDWSGGYGDYTEGTFYGETTDFYISYILCKTEPKHKTFAERKDDLVEHYKESVEALIKEQNDILNGERVKNTSVRHIQKGKGTIVEISPNETAIIRIRFADENIASYGFEVATKRKLLLFENPETIGIINYALSLNKKIFEYKQRIKKLETAQNSTELYELLKEYSK